MAGIFERIALMFKTKANKTLDKYEDPRETLDYSYERQLELLRKVRRGVADVATSRKRVELQAQQMNGEVEKLQSAAQRALAANREDLAREALTRKAGLQQQEAEGDEGQDDRRREERPPGTGGHRLEGEGPVQLAAQ